MYSTNRDILYCLKKVYVNPDAVEREIEWLHAVLRDVESVQNFCRCHEVIDLNRYRISSKPLFIKRIIRK